jgi:outer membrane protein
MHTTVENNVKMTRRFGTCAAILAAALATNGAHADAGTWEVRLRAVNLDPANNSDAYAPLQIPKDAIHINGKWIPDLDLEWFFSQHLSSELLLTLPQSQKVTVEHSALGGPTVIGTFKHLPPTLTLKYNFLPGSTFQPYVGAGINFTLISDVNISVPTVGRLDLNNHSVGPAAQAGFDYKLADHWYFSGDVKWIMIRSDVKFEGTKISQARLDPFLFGVGIGYRFNGG